MSFDEDQTDIARDAFARYGKGRHKAALNFGDCAAYALAIAEAEPLLFKGTDFGETDVTVAQLMPDPQCCRAVVVASRWPCFPFRA